MGIETISCLFCATPCSPSFTLIDGRLTRLKSEEAGGYRSSSSPSPSGFLDEEKNTLLAQQLEVIFTLKNILKLEDETITQLLGMLDGQFNPEFWFQLCQSCGTSVKEYFDTLKELNRLKKRLTTISDGLKTKIEKTKESHQDAERDGDEEEISKSVWKQIRMETLNNMTDPDAEPLSKFQNDLSNGTVLIDGDIRVEWDEQDGCLNLDVPDLSSLKQGFGLVEHSSQKVTIQERIHPPHSLENATTSSQPQSAPKKLTSPPIVEYIMPSFSSNMYRRPSYKCEDCPYVSRLRRSDLIKHQALHKPGSTAISCSICGWLLLPRNLGHHMGYHHPTDPLATPVASGTPKKLSKHPGKRSFAAKKVYKCSDCGALFHNLIVLKQHKELHAKGEGINCLECGWLIPTSHSIRHNTLWHSNEGIRRAERMESFRVRKVRDK